MKNENRNPVRIKKVWGLLPVISMLTVSAVSYAQVGDKGGNGGDPLELRMENVKSELRNWILATEFRQINLDGQDPKLLANFVLKSIDQSTFSLTDKKLMIGGKERACINYPQTQSIECNRAKLSAETDANLYPLMLHEYMGLAGLEQNRGEESDYKYSRQARDFVEYKMVAKLGVMRRGDLGTPEMHFVAIAKGSFELGYMRPDPEIESRQDHSVNKDNFVQVDAFEIQTTEVTQAQYVKVTGYNPSEFRKKEHCPTEHRTIDGEEICPNHPVESVSWEQATAFAAKYTKLAKDGYIYRLPTEAEWEYAAISGGKAAFSYRNATHQLEDNSWFKVNSGIQTHPVGQKLPNLLGIYDLFGNVWEWTNAMDIYPSLAYRDSEIRYSKNLRTKVSDEDHRATMQQRAQQYLQSTGLPEDKFRQDLQNKQQSLYSLGVEACSLIKRTIRGGSWNNVKSFDRNSIFAAYSDSKSVCSRDVTTGFRLVRVRQ